VPHEQIHAIAERGKRSDVVYLDNLVTRLGAVPFLAVVRFSYADIVGYVYLGFAARALGGGVAPLEGRPRLARWHETIAARPAIQRST
jgi:glutathione S-transferase